MKMSRIEILWTLALASLAAGPWLFFPACDDGGSSSDGDADTDSDTDSDTDGDTDDTCLDEIAWFAANSEGQAMEIKQKDPNDYGLYDMIGNASEWVQDCYSDSYNGAPDNGSAWTEGDCDYRVMRGGCYGSTPRALRVSAREGFTSNFYGACLPTVRCARNLVDDEPDGGVDDSDGGVYIDLTWIEIPGGSFQMGCSDGDDECYDNESPVHNVDVPGFEMLEAEVTQQEYFDQTSLVPSTYHCPECAVTGVSWDAATDFCAQLGGRLPTEAEWEYAARGGNASRYYCED